MYPIGSSSHASTSISTSQWLLSRPSPSLARSLRSSSQLTLYFSHSLVTVVLSLLSDCPTFTFYMLEIIVNTAMIVEVSIRLVAFGKVSS